MNVKHLQYMIEIERVGSISQAAKNLYVGQPNLSRILKEVEDTVGFAILTVPIRASVPPNEA
jgi:DNA-binding transcriptional LysR family regulator